MDKILLAAVSLGVLWGIMTLGVHISYRILDHADLTVEGSITLGAAISSSMIAAVNAAAESTELAAANPELFEWIGKLVPVVPYLSLLVAVLGGMLAGLVTGLLHTRLGIPALLSGILTQLALYSINLRIMGRATVSLLRMDTVFTGVANAFGLSQNLSVLLVGGVITAALVAVLYWFFGTELGCAIRATGDNENMARAQGINTNAMKRRGLILSNALVALAGALIAQNQSFADLQMGIGSIVIGLASLFIGEVLFTRGNFAFRLISVVLGAVVYRVIIALVIEMGMDPNDLRLFTAITVAIALALPQLGGQLAARRGRKANATKGE